MLVNIYSRMPLWATFVQRRQGSSLHITCIFCQDVIRLFKHYGKYTDLIEQGVDFAGAVDFDEKHEDGEGDETSAAGEEIVAEKGDAEDADGAIAKKNAEMKKKGENLTTKEEHKEGAVEWMTKLPTVMRISHRVSANSSALPALYFASQRY